MSPEAVRHTGSILDAIRLERTGQMQFRGHAHPGPTARTYGGEVAGQAVLAAGRTVPGDRPVHAIHMYFLLPGDTTVPTDFHVSEVRDGGSFTTRRVEASQAGRVIFTMLASFQLHEAGMSHQLAALAVPGPDDLPPIEVTFGPESEDLDWVRRLVDRAGVDARFPVPPARCHTAPGHTGEPRQSAWLRAREPLPDGALEQAACLTYLSDMLLLSSALGPHGRTLQDGSLQFATINHSVWFHAPLRVDEWFFYDQESRWAGGARALAHGEILDQAGRHCATTMQEGLLRLR